MVVTFAQWVIRWRFFVLFAAVAAVMLAAAGASKLQFTTDYRVFFSKENPQLQAFEALQNTYTKNDNVLFVVAPKDRQVFSRETLTAVEWLTQIAWKIPYSIRVDSLTNFQYTYANGDDLVVQDLVSGAATLGNAALARIKDIALAEPLLVNRLVSPEAHVTGVNVTIQLPGKAPQREVPEVVAWVRDLADQLRGRYPGIDVHLTGMVMMNNAFPEASQHDLRTLVPLMFLVVIVVLGLLLRVWSGTVATVLVIAFSIITGMGLAGWLDIRLTGPSASAPIIILTLAVADCVHILTNFVYALRRGTEKRAAMVESLRINFQPVFLTSLTTAIGFLSMNFSDSPPFRDLGNIAAMGVGAAFVLAIAFLPALMIVLPVRVRRVQSRGGRAMEQFADFVVRRRQPLLLGIGPLILLLIFFIPRNELNDEFVKYFDETISFRRATDFAAANLTGIYLVQYSLGAGETGGISNPAFLKKLDEFAQWYRSQPEVEHVSVITDTFKRLNKNLHGDNPAWYRLPEDRQLAAQYLLLYEMSLPFGLDLNDQINVDKSATRLTVTLHNLSTNKVLALEERAQQWLKANVPPFMQADGSSPTIMFSHIGARNIRSMLVGTTAALVLISIILIVALRSLKIGLVSMIPNLAPIGMAFGLWGLIVGQVGLAISVIAAMSLGIIVDDSVHFLSKYLRARRENELSASDAVRYAFSTVGTALWVTSLILIAGFLVLSFSAFEINAGMGLLTAITIALALLTDFLFLPPLLMKLEERRDEKMVAVDTAHISGS